MTADLVAFLRARLDETQDDAERGYLKAEPIPGYEGRDASGTAGLPPAVAARVLRDVAAKRAIVEQYVKACGYGHGAIGMRDEAYVLAEGALAKTVEFLATEYSDHPEYKEEWKP